MLRNSLFALAALTLAGCATDPAAPTRDRDCFPANSVNGYEVVDDHTVRVHVSASRNYIMTTRFNARDLNWTHAIALRSQSGFICTGSGLGVDVIGGDLGLTYPVDQITRGPDDPVPGS